MWSLSTTTLQVSLRVQLNSILFAKTLVRKDVASSSSLSENKAKDKNDIDAASEDSEKKDEEGDFSSKAQIMTLMTTDVDRVSEFAWHMFTLVGASRAIVITAGTLSNYLRLPNRDHYWHDFFVPITGIVCFYWTRCDMPVPPFESFRWKGRRWRTGKSYEGER